MLQIGIFFGGKDSGTTAKVARRIQELLGAEATVHNVAGAAKHDVEKYDFLVLGTAAWGIGEMHSERPESLSRKFCGWHGDYFLPFAIQAKCGRLYLDPGLQLLLLNRRKRWQFCWVSH